MNEILTLNETDSALLKEIGGDKFFTLVRFELRAGDDRDNTVVILDNVHMSDSSDTVDEIRARAKSIRELEDAGLIETDFRPPVIFMKDYDVYAKSAIFDAVTEIAAAGQANGLTLFDTAVLCPGIAVLTYKGKRMLNRRYIVTED